MAWKSWQMTRKVAVAGCLAGTVPQSLSGSCFPPPENLYVAAFPSAPSRSEHYRPAALSCCRAPFGHAESYPASAVGHKGSSAAVFHSFEHAPFAILHTYQWSPAAPDSTVHYVFSTGSLPGFCSGGHSPSPPAWPRDPCHGHHDTPFHSAQCWNCCTWSQRQWCSCADLRYQRIAPPHPPRNDIVHCHCSTG